MDIGLPSDRRLAGVRALPTGRNKEQAPEEISGPATSRLSAMASHIKRLGGTACATPPDKT